MRFDGEDRLRTLSVISGTVPVSAGPSAPLHVAAGSTAPLYVAPAPYYSSPFGAFRAAADLVFRDNSHLYPGPSTAYDPDAYGFEADAGVKGSATHLPNESAIRLAVSDGTSGAKARLRTHDYVRYQAGAATSLEITGYQSSTGSTDQVRRLGLFDDSDGVFFETRGTTNYLVVRSSATGSIVDGAVPQASWNVNTYASLDVRKGNRFRFVIAWLGVEGIQCFINGTLVHVFSFSNTLARPYMKTATLPISAEIENVGASAAGSLTYICSSARILNGGSYPYLGYGYSRSTTGITSTITPLMSFRIKSTLNGVASRVQMLPTSISFFAESASGAVILSWNPTLTGATYAATSPSPGVEVDTAATVISGGTDLWRLGLAKDSSVHVPLTDIFSLAGRKLRRQAFTGTSDVLTVAVVREGAINFDPFVTLNWNSLR